MSTCAFFGHRNEFFYSGMEDKISEAIRYVIDECGVTEFYCGYRGEFDMICAHEVYWLRKNGYPNIKNIMVLSYLRNNKYDKFVLPYVFDESVYLLERHVPPRAAIIATNKMLAAKVDYIISGVDCVNWRYGGAFEGVEYGRKHGKKIISILD